MKYTELSRFGRIYVTTIVLAGTGAISQALYSAYTNPIDHGWFILAALTLLTGSFTVNLPSIPATISVSEAFIFSSVLLFGPAAGTLTVALDGLVISFWLQRRKREVYKALFNTSAPAVSVWVTAHVFFGLARIPPLSVASVSTSFLFVPLIIFTASYFFLNSWLTAIAVSLERPRSIFQIWRGDFLWLSLNFFSGASAAFLLVSISPGVTISSVTIILPLLVVSYLTFSTTMERISDADRHVAELSKLHVSTIETLAMAIDAKDQITWGHIRRVQIGAMRLAEAVGVRHEKLMRAIEAAALLHDMGKLAVPEYILNKPGKLSPSEFDRMKLHASVGAEILSAIKFPYPVVPIVRHHHENWDGTGYPAGLAGTDIPIGARILAVADCFDALTSDRPYRPRLSTAAALDELRLRRGTMYDPFIVDVFVRLQSQIMPAAELLQQNSPSLVVRSQTDSAEIHQRHFDEISRSGKEMISFYELGRALERAETFQDIGTTLCVQLRELIPAALYVIFLYDRASNALRAAYVSSTAANEFLGLRILQGEQVSGWVAAHRYTICNSLAAFDLGPLASRIESGLTGCLATPLTVEDHLVGVLSAYAQDVKSFDEGHRRIIEAVAKIISPALGKLTSTICPSSVDSHVEKVVERMKSAPA